MNVSVFFQLCLVWMILGGVRVSRADLPPSVHISLTASRTQVTIGDSLSITCEVTAPDSIQFKEPYLKNPSLFFDISKERHFIAPSTGGAVSARYSFLVYAFSPDTLTIGPFILDFMTRGGLSGSIESDSLKIIVTSVVKGTSVQPEPDRGPFEIPFKWPSARTILLMLAAVAVITALLYYILRRKRNSVIEIPEKPIDEFGEFERIRSMNLIETGQLKELYFLVSLALRGFIHRNMGFDAMYETTDEITMNLQMSSHGENIRKTISSILKESDMVKFALFQPLPEAAESLIDRALIPVRAVIEENARREELLRINQGENAHQEKTLSLTTAGGGGD